MRVINIGLDTTDIIDLSLCGCIGYFDGMHIGHQKLVKATVEMAKRNHCESALITFDPDPWVVLKNLENVQHISTMEQRMNKASSLGIDNIVIIAFTKKLSMLSPEDFVTKVLNRLNLKGLVCGFDYHYGAMGKGNCDTLKASVSYPVEIIDSVNDTIGKISSTRISECIRNGDMESVRLLLGDDYCIEGIVKHGNSKGTSMGFPTANISYSAEYILPKTGVYACIAVHDGKKYPAMVNLGHNPTMNYSRELSLEAHLIGFEGDLYDHNVSLHFRHFMRPEMKFASREALIDQLKQDVIKTEKFFDNYEK